MSSAGSSRLPAVLSGIAALVLGVARVVADQHSSARAQQAVVGLPAELDVVNSRQVREELAAASCGVTTVIADMTRTTICDGEGAYSLAQAHRQLAAGNVELRLVVPSATVRGVLAMLALDDLVPTYPSLEAALGPGPAPPPPGDRSVAASPGPEG